MNEFKKEVDSLLQKIEEKKQKIEFTRTRSKKILANFGKFINEINDALTPLSYHVIASVDASEQKKEVIYKLVYSYTGYQDIVSSSKKIYETLLVFDLENDIINSSTGVFENGTNYKEFNDVYSLKELDEDYNKGIMINEFKNIITLMEREC